MSYLNAGVPGYLGPDLNGDHALAMVIIAGAWKQVAYNFIFFLAALQTIPRSLIEAGAMDGASVLRRVRDIQLPLLAPTFFFVLVINITDSFTDSFGIVDTMTGGGPARATNLMVYKIYVDGFQGLDYSGAAAQSIILMLSGHCADRRPVPLHRTQGALLMTQTDLPLAGAVGEPEIRKVNPRRKPRARVWSRTRRS